MKRASVRVRVPVLRVLVLVLAVLASAARARAGDVILNEIHYEPIDETMLLEFVEGPIRELTSGDALVEPTEPPRGVGANLGASRGHGPVVVFDGRGRVECRLPVIASERGACFVELRHRL